MSSTDLVYNLKEETKTDDPLFSHIIDRGNDERPADAIVLEARVLGLYLKAICGKEFIPTRDPLKLPLCEECRVIFEFARDFRGV